MLNLFLTNLAEFGLSSNIVVCSGTGALIYGREKRYTFFRYISVLFLILGVCICSFANYFLTNYVYSKFDIFEIQVGVLVLLACLYNLLISKLWKKMSLFGLYLYNSSCSYVFDAIFTVYVAMILDTTLAIVPFVFSLLAAVVVVFVMTVLIGFYVEGINKSSLRICFRNVSARLYLLAIFAIILYYASMLV